MKILFEGNNLTENEAQDIFSIIITEDYSVLENKETENGDYAIFSNGLSLLKVETNFSEETNLNHLRIIDLQKDNVDQEIFKFKIISSKQLENLKVSQNQIITIIEALKNYKKYISNTEYTTNFKKLRTEFEKEKVNVIFNYLQEIIDYNYDGACINCMNKKLKKNDMGLGDSGLEQSAKIKKNKEKEVSLSAKKK